MDKDKENKTSNFKKIFVALVIIVLIAIIGVMAWMLLKPKSEPNEKPTAELGVGRSTVATRDNINDILQQRDSPVDDGYFETEMNTEWSFENGKSESLDAYVGNSVNNLRTIYFDVVLKDTGEMVYSSPYIPVGASVEKFALSTDLSKGTYAAECQYHLVDESNNEVSTLGVSVTINILN